MFPVLPDEATICPTFNDFDFSAEADYNDISMSEKISNVFDFEPIECRGKEEEEPCHGSTIITRRTPLSQTRTDPLYNTTLALSADLINVPSDDEEDAAYDVPGNDVGDDADSHAGFLSKVMSSSNFVSDISKLIASEKSEYCYFNTQFLKNKWNLKRMSHWNPFKKPST